MKSMALAQLGVPRSITQMAATKMALAVVMTVGNFAAVPFEASAEKPLFTLELRIIKARNPQGVNAQHAATRSDLVKGDIEKNIATNNLMAQNVTLETDSVTLRQKPVIDPDIIDLTSSLSSLPFTSFMQIKKLQKQVEMKQKVGFSLCGGQALIVRPLYRTGNTLGVWLRWIDADGAPIIDTRMHIDGQQPIIIGNEGAVRETGRVLALSVQPDPIN